METHTTNLSSRNPFSVQTPEEISADDAYNLFVNVFTDFPTLLQPGHMFIHGPRGSGKSMMFRYLQPDCQMLDRKSELGSLPFYGVYCPVKNTNLLLTDLLRLRSSYADGVLNEHFMVLYFAERVFSSLASAPFKTDQNAVDEVRAFVESHFSKLLKRCGWKGEVPTLQGHTVEKCFRVAEGICDDLYADVLNYLKRLTPTITPDFNGPLCGYLDFLYPLLREMRRLSIMPEGPIFLLIDDADNFNRTQTAVLNSWIATRTSNDVSIKVSTQMNYKTYQTLSGQYIDRTHDYTEVDIATTYTSSKDRYMERIKEIVKRRLAQTGISASPEEFFPPDVGQEDAIKAIADDLRLNWEKEGRGYRPSDDVVRYSRPSYIASLKGTRKSGSTYSYAGFPQLVHISSALVRYFLEPAALMFSRQASENGGKPVTQIDPKIQNEVVRKESNNLLFEQIDKLASEEGQGNEYYSRVRKLANLIHNLGGVFHQVLVSNRSERRVFSIALSNPPDEEIRSVLKLGVQQGYFHTSSLGNKDGTGRTPLYILTRRLAPSFLLDPSSFAGYLWVTNQYLKDAMNDPKLTGRIKEKGVDEYFNNGQLELTFS